MKKHLLLLPLLLCLLAALPGRSQLAAIVDSSIRHGTLFTDGTTLYEIHTDTLSSVNTGTGSRTMLHKLPSFLPQGTTTATWGTRYNIKTTNGFITTCDYNTSSASYKIWSYNGSSWDTILAPYYSWTPQSAPVQIGTDYIYLFTKDNGNATTVTIVKTNGTNTGTQVLFRDDYPTNQLLVDFPLYPNSSPALFYIRHLDSYSSTAQPRHKIGTVDNTGARLIDSSAVAFYTAAQLGNNLYCVKGLTGIPNYSCEINKYDLNTLAKVNLISTTTDMYNVGIGFKNKIITSRLSAPYDNTIQRKLISIDPVTGVQTILADSLSYYAPDCNISEAAVGKNHLFIPFNPNFAYPTMVNSRYVVLSDGITSRNKPSIHLSNAQRFGIARSSFEMSYGTVCQDELYFRSRYVGGMALDLRLFRLIGNNTVDSQLNCQIPSNFIRVNGEIYFRGSYMGGSIGSNPNSLWKITACSVPAAVTNLPEISQANLYPNPAHTAITIALPSNTSSTTLELYDATGRRVLSQAVQQQQSVPIAHLPNGLYIYRIIAPNGVILTSDRLSITH